MAPIEAEVLALPDATFRRMLDEVILSHPIRLVVTGQQRALTPNERPGFPGRTRPLPVLGC